MVRPMQIESLLPPDEGIHVGFAVVEMNEGLSKDDVIQIAQSSSAGVRAIQILDSRLIVDDGHILSAVQNAIYAHRGDYQKSRTLDVEIAVYASGQRQISRAFDLVGVSERTRHPVIIVIGSSQSEVRKSLLAVITRLGTPLENAFQPDKKRLQDIIHTFDISESELSTFTSSPSLQERQQALSKCVAHKVSMVALDT